MNGPTQSDNLSDDKVTAERNDDLYKLVNPAMSVEVPAMLQDRWQLVSRVQWNSTATFGTVLYQTDNFWTSLFHTTTSSAYANNPLVRYVNGFRQFISDIEVRITIQGTMNAYGAILVATDPRFSTTNWCTYMADPNKLFMMANDPGSMTYIIPYKDCVYSNVSPSRDPWGNFAIFCAGPLRNSSTTTVPTALITVEARPRNMRVKYPTNSVTYQSKTSLREATNVAMGDMLSAGAKSLGKVVFKSVKAASGVIHPLLPAALDMLPFDRPIDPSNPERAVIVDTDILSQITGSTVSRRLGLAPVAPLPSIPRPDKVDYTKYSNYGKIESIVTWGNILAATPLDQVFLTVPVTPSYTNAVTAAAPNVVVNTGPLQWLAHNHGLWRGSIKYKLYIHCPSTANTQLRITLDDAPLTTVPSQDSGNVYNMLVDVRGNSVIEFTVPYMGRTVYTPTAPNPGWTTSQYVSTGLSVFDTGFLNITKVTGTLSPFNVPVEPSFLLTACLGDDFQFAEPVGPELQETFTYQADVKPLFPADYVVEDAVSVTNKIDNWRDFFKMAEARGDSNFAMRYTEKLPFVFRCARGSFRYVLKPTTELTIRSNAPGLLGTTRRGAIWGSFESNKWHSFEIPHQSARPWNYTTGLFESTNTTSFFTTGYPSFQYRSMTDDCDFFFPVACPTIIAPSDAV